MGYKIASRIVTRYYVNGRGYATLRNAARAQAKSELNDQVLGKSDVWPYRPHLEDELTRQNQRGLTGKKAESAAFSALFGERFPHEEVRDCRSDICWVTDDGDRYSASCRAAQRAWMESRMAEIIEEAE